MNKLRLINNKQSNYFMTDINLRGILKIFSYSILFCLISLHSASNAADSIIEESQKSVIELKEKRSDESNLVDPQKTDSELIDIFPANIQTEESTDDVLIVDDIDDGVIQVDDATDEILNNLNDKSKIIIVEKITLPNGSVYSGEVKFDVIREGLGTNEWPNGDRYKGEWLNDNPHGKGYKWIKNKDEYHGFFAFGQFSGLGDLKTASGERYLGNFRFNQLDGLGIFISTNKEYYLGEFSQHKRHGRFLYYSQLSAKPKYQLWFNDVLEKTIDANSIDDNENTHERQLINQMLQKFSLIAKKRLQQRRSNTHYQIRGRVRKIVSDVDDSPEHAFGDLIINLLDINE